MFRHIACFVLLTVAMSCLIACSDSETIYAPVADAAFIEPIPKNGLHRVKPGETIYAIAWRYGLDYRRVAQLNDLKSPYFLPTGKIIYLKKRPPFMHPMMTTPAMPKPVKPVPQIISPKKIVKVSYEPKGRIDYWRRPTYGRIIKGFSSRNRGLNFAGHLGDPIFATAPGKVVYSGDGLRTYGNLIIIKHNSAFLSAYAHTRINLVKAGDIVKGGDKIAEMGNTGVREVMLHFEIRHDGKPVNPLMYVH